jgi:hypothetical protein
MPAGFVWIALLALGLPSGAAALAPPPSARAALECGCFDRSGLAQLHQRILNAGSVAEARALALDPALDARRALARARWIVPSSAALHGAEARLAAYGRSVRAAPSRAEVGRRFAELVSLAPAAGTGRSFVREPAACSFTTLEIVAIVLGFILGIIPGIILLLILC